MRMDAPRRRNCGMAQQVWSGYRNPTVVVLGFLLLLGTGTGDVAAQRVRETVAVNAVQIRVSAADAAGRPLRDLAAGDLSLRVDGHPVPIDSFELEQRPGAVGLEDSSQAAGSSALRVGRTGTLAIAIVIDESTSAIPIRKDALNQLLGFVDQGSIDREFLVCSYRLGSIRLDQSWTTQIDSVRSTLRRLRDHPTVENSPTGVLTSRTSVLEFQMLRSRLLTALMQVIAMFPDGPVSRQLILITGGKTLASVLDLSGTLTNENTSNAGFRSGNPASTVPDPSAVDTPAQPFGDGFELWGRAVGGAMSRSGNADLVAKALERDITLVPVVTSSPDAAGAIDVERRTSAGSKNQTSGLSAQLSANQALWGLARETGGTLLLAGSAGTQLAGLADRASYLLSFRDEAAEPGRLHSVEIASSRPGVVLEYRRGFRVRSPEERALDKVFANFVVPSSSDDALSLSVSVSPAKTAGPPRTTMALRFSPPLEDASPPTRLVEVVAVGKAADGTWTLPVRWSGQAYEAQPGRYEARIELGVAPGSRVWSVALRDLATSLEGYARTGPNRP